MPNVSDAQIRALINNTYAYPNPDAYSSFGRSGTTLLLHGFISSMQTTTTGTGAGVHMSSDVLIKKFQFNPPSSEIILQMLDVDPAATLNAGGNDTVGGVGAASTSLKLAFNREIEVYKATTGQTSVPAYFKEIGVQKDVLDVYRVMLGKDTPSALGGSDLGGLNDMVGELFDSGVAGRNVNMKPIIVSWNRTLTYFGNVRGFSFEYQKFNSRLVPTIVAMTINIDIMNISSARAIANSQANGGAQPQAGSGTGGGLPATGTSSGSSTTVPNSGPTTPQGPGTQLPPPYISSGGIHWGG